MSNGLLIQDTTSDVSIIQQSGSSLDIQSCGISNTVSSIISMYVTDSLASNVLSMTVEDSKVTVVPLLDVTTIRFPDTTVLSTASGYIDYSDNTNVIALPNSYTVLTSTQIKNLPTLVLAGVYSIQLTVQLSITGTVNDLMTLINFSGTNVSTNNDNSYINYPNTSAQLGGGTIANIITQSIILTTLQPNVNDGILIMYGGWTGGGSCDISVRQFQITYLGVSTGSS